jgi:putative NIF3 family GTP cyclohydrolase 1 type 2
MRYKISLNLLRAAAFIILLTVSSFSEKADRIENTVSDNILYSNLTAQDVASRIVRYTGLTWNEETVDKFKAGSAGTKITGVATTFLATLDVMKRAVEQNCNFILTHEPTFYNHFDDTAPLEKDPVQKEKMKFIADHNLVVFRFHDHIHMMKPDVIVRGIVKGLGWEKYLVKGEENVFVIPETTLENLAGSLEKHYNVETIRVIGNPELKCTKIGLSVGAPASMDQIMMLQRDDIEVLIAGESREWETVEYVRDAMDAGMNKAIILLGHVISEEDGMKYLSEDLQNIFPEIPVKFIPAKNPFWNP